MVNKKMKAKGKHKVVKKHISRKNIEKRKETLEKKPEDNLEEEIEDVEMELEEVQKEEQEDSNIIKNDSLKEIN